MRVVSHADIAHGNRVPRTSSTARLSKSRLDELRSLILDMLIAENCFTIPLNIPLGVGLS